MPVIDDYSRFVTTYFMARKSDAAELLLNCIKQNEIHTGNQVKTKQTDNGGEFTSNYLRKSFEEKEIRLQPHAGGQSKNHYGKRRPTNKILAMRNGDRYSHHEPHPIKRDEQKVTLRIVDKNEARPPAPSNIWLPCLCPYTRSEAF